MPDGFWNVIVPEATTNQIDNPSFEVNATDGWTLISGSSKAQDSTLQKFGLYSCKFTTDLAVGGFKANAASNISSLAIGDSVTASGWFYVPSTNGVGDTTVLTITSNGATGTGTTRATGTIVTTTTDTWQYVSCSWTNDTAGAVSIFLNVTCSDTATGALLYMDGVQLEEKAYATTFIDGSLPGGTWLGVHNNSPSTREADEQTGGRITNFLDDLSYTPSRMQGVGMPPIQLGTAPYAQDDGSYFQSHRYAERNFQFVLSTPSNTDQTTLHSNRQALVKSLDPRVGKINTPPTPRRLRYTGATVTKEIDAFLDGGLDLNIGSGFFEDVTVRFLAPDPMFKEVGNTAKVLDSNDTVSYYGVSRRTDSGWDNVSVSAITAPNQVWSIAEGKGDGYVYVVGDFLNFDGTANSDYIARYNKETAVWDSITTTTPPNGKVWRVRIAPNGDVYVCGEFTGIDSVADTDKIAYWDGNNWNALGTGALNAGEYIYDMEFDEAGDLYVVGTFAGAASIRGVNADRFAKWDGSTWSEVGGGVDNNSVYGIAVAPNNNLYLCGDFTSVNNTATTVRGVARWTGSAWGTMNGGLATTATTTIARDIQVDAGGAVYCCGDFTQNDAGTTVNYFTRWNGTTWEPLIAGLNDTVRRIFVRGDGTVVLVGDFTGESGSASAKTLNSAAIWNGSEYLNIDLSLSNASPNIRGIAEIDGELWLGHDNEAGGDGASQQAGQTTISYNGTAPANLQIVIERSGGTSANIVSLIQETTGAALHFNYYGLLDGEKLTIDTATGLATSSMFGKVPKAVKASSDLSLFKLQSGNASGAYDNVLSLFVEVVGSPTITAYALWQDTYISVD